MKGKLIKTGNDYILRDLSGEVLGITIGEINGKLSLKNCQAIERGYDLDELAGEYANKELNVELTSKVGNFYGFSSSFKEGFQKALEIYHNDLNILPRKNEWEVEILMEEVAIGDKYTPDPKPKLDADWCLILKRVV